MWRAPAAIAVVLLLVSLTVCRRTALREDHRLARRCCCQVCRDFADGHFCSWRLSGSLSQTLDLAGEKLISMRFSDDGRLLAAGGGSGRVRIWELPSASLKLEFSGPSQVRGLAISRDRTLIAAAPLGEAVEVWDVAATEQVVKIRAAFGGTKALAFSPDGHWLATADGDTSIRMYDARTGRLRNTVDDLLLESFAIVFSTDGRCILTGGADKVINVINVIDASNGKLLRSLAKQDDVLLDLRQSRDGKRLAAAYVNADDPSKPAPVVIWDLETQSARTRILEPGIVPNGGEFLSDGRLLMTSGSEKELKIWSVSR